MIAIATWSRNAGNMPGPASPSTGSSIAEKGQITVLTLDGTEYAVHGTFARGEQATSKLLPGFGVDVTDALAAKR